VALFHLTGTFAVKSTFLLLKLLIKVMSEKFLQEAANTAEIVNDSQTSVLESVDQPPSLLAIMISN
jgi:hypothetical protein